MEFTPVAWKLLAAVLVTLEGHTALNQTRCDFFTQYIDVFPSENKTITSPNYPLKYPNNEQCRWRFDAGSDYTQPDYVVKVTFNDLILSYTEDAADDCLNDKLEFRDGGDMYSQESKLIGKYCYKIHPEVIYSSGRYLHVNFQSNSINTYKGFSITVSSVKAEESYGMCHVTAAAGAVHRPSGSSGNLYTPGYPVPYPANTNCLWVITVPFGKRVKLTFENFQLEETSPFTGNNDCEYDKNLDIPRDYVEIRDGPRASSRELGVHCGNDLDLKFYSTGNQMWIKFRPSSSKSGKNKGFKAHFEAIEPIASEKLCLPGNPNNDNLKLTGLDGTLQTPMAYYPPDLNCDWIITVPKDHTVELSFDRFELDHDGANGECKEDYVEILDGLDSNSKSPGRLCGLTSPGTIRSTGPYMRVRFRSDNGGAAYMYQGFKATYSAVKKSSTGLNSALLALAIIILILVIVVVLLVGFVLYLVKQRKTLKSEVDAVPLSTSTTA